MGKWLWHVLPHVADKIPRPVWAQHPGFGGGLCPNQPKHHRQPQNKIALDREKIDLTGLGL